MFTYFTTLTKTELSFRRLMMQREGTVQRGAQRGEYMVRICWSYMAVCVPFSVAAPQVFPWEPGFFLTCRIQVVLTSSPAAGGGRAPAQSASHSECYFLLLQTRDGV